MRQHINLLLLAGLQTVHTHPAEPLTNCFNLLISSAIWTGPATTKSVNWQMALPDSDVAIISVIKSKNAVACSHAFHGLLKKHFQKKMLQLQIITAALLSLPFFGVILTFITSMIMIAPVNLRVWRWNVCAFVYACTLFMSTDLLFYYLLWSHVKT